MLTEVTVAAVSPSAITLLEGKRRVELPATRPLHLGHAYATTIHSSQGPTADRVLIDAATRSSTTAEVVTFALRLAAATRDSGAPDAGVAPDQEVIDHLDELQELLQNLELFEEPMGGEKR